MTGMLVVRRSWDSLTRLTLRSPRLAALSIVLLILAIASLALPRLAKDSSPNLLPPSHSSRVHTDHFRDTFTGSKEMAIVVLEAEDTIFNEATLRRIRELSAAFAELGVATPEALGAMAERLGAISPAAGARFEALIASGFDSDSLDAVEEIRASVAASGAWNESDDRRLDVLVTHIFPVIEVNSLATLDNILAEGQTLVVDPIYEEVPTTQDGLDRLRLAVTQNALFDGVLYDDSERFTGIFIELAIDDDDSPALIRLYAAILDVLGSHPGPEKHYVAGFPIVSATWDSVMTSDLEKLFPVVLLLVLGCLWASFRMLLGMLAPLLVAVMSIVLTISLQALLGIPINFISNLLPVFLISIAVADSIHIFSEYRDRLAEGVAPKTAVVTTIGNLLTPIAITSITTAIGFWALAYTELWQIRDFGIFVGVGAIVAMALSLLLLPALLAAFPPRAPFRSRPSTRLDRAVLSGLVRVSRLSLRRPRTVLVTVATALGLSIAGAASLTVENDSISYFAEETPLVKSTQRIERHFSGTYPLNIVLRANTTGEPFKDPTKLQKIESLHQLLDADPLVGRTQSLVSLIKRINLVLHEGDPAYDRLPETVESINGHRVSGRDQVAQFALLYESGGGDILDDVVDSRFETAHLLAVLRTTSSSEIGRLIKRVQAWHAESFARDAEIAFAGNSVISVAHGTEMVRGLVSSLLLSSVLITALLALVFRSVWLGMLGILPLLCTVVLNFGLMRILNLTLNPGTVVVSSIAIGIGVDYSVHYLARLTRAREGTGSGDEAVLRTVTDCGKAIVYNALTVGVGFLALTLSGFEPLVTMGVLIFTTMIISAFATLVVLPAALSLRTPAAVTTRGVPGASGLG